MAGEKNGARLVKKLIASGTPADDDGPLKWARTTLHEIHASDNRVATSDEIIAALIGAKNEKGEWLGHSGLGDHNGTVRKAMHIAEFGEWTDPNQGAKTPIEDRVLADEEEKAKPKDDDKKLKDNKPK